MIEFNSNWMFLRDVSSMMGTLYGEQNVPVEVMLPHDAMVLGRRMKIIQLEMPELFIREEIICIQKPSICRKKILGRQFFWNLKEFTAAGIRVRESIAR